jgi:hypothetical protein
MKTLLAIVALVFLIPGVPAYAEEKEPLAVIELGSATAWDRGGPVFRNRMAAWLRWILGWITPPISPRLSA